MASPSILCPEVSTPHRQDYPTDGVFPHMAWAKPNYSRKEINKAGRLLVANHWYDADFLDVGQMFDTINNWRSVHSYPLLASRMTLTGRARGVDTNAIIAQRLKRLQSIKTKLHNNENMALSQMQDIGGCRAVVATSEHLDRLVSTYGNRVHHKKYDYIQNPKDDGYRGAHFVCKYKSNLKQNKVWIGLRIEVQLRSRLQHAWATGVETVDTFSRQSLKTGGGKKDWKRFFALMGSDIAAREGKPLVPGTPPGKEVLADELRHYAEKLRVISLLQGWSAAIKHMQTSLKSGAQACVLMRYITPFTDEETAMASHEYMEEEKRIASQRKLCLCLFSP